MKFARHYLQWFKYSIIYHHHMVFETILCHVMFQEILLDRLFAKVTLVVTNPSVASSDTQKGNLVKPLVTMSTLCSLVGIQTISMVEG